MADRRRDQETIDYVAITGCSRRTPTSSTGARGPSSRPVPRRRAGPRRHGDEPGRRAHRARRDRRVHRRRDRTIRVLRVRDPEHASSTSTATTARGPSLHVRAAPGPRRAGHFTPRVRPVPRRLPAGRGPLVFAGAALSIAGRAAGAAKCSRFPRRSGDHDLLRGATATSARSPANASRSSATATRADRGR